MVTFYKIDSNGHAAEPVLFLDTLKMSTVEQTASTADARGGKGNPKLITWDYGKEINVNIEDALFSPKSLNLMFGGAKGQITADTSVLRTASYHCGSTSIASGSLPKIKVENGKFIICESTESAYSSATTVSWYDANGSAVTSMEANGRYVGKYNPTVNASVITISADSFPGTYYITGDTYARNDTTGEDEFFQFVIPKAKVTAENTITLEAEGDPSTFSMSLTVLRPENGEMMQLIKYDVNAAG